MRPKFLIRTSGIPRRPKAEPALSHEELLRVECDRRLLDKQCFERAESWAFELCDPVPFMRGEPNEDRRLALTFAAVVSYVAPFTRLRDGRGRAEWRHRFRSLYLDALESDDERDLHDRMRKLRNGFIGHADAEAADIRYLKMPGGSSRTIVNPLSKDTACQLRLLAERFRRLADDRYRDLHSQVVAAGPPDGEAAS